MLETFSKMHGSSFGLFRRSALIPFCIIALALWSAPVAPIHAAATSSYSVPILNVPIPGLDFKDYPIYVEPGLITVPFLAVYILSFYKIIMGIGLVAAAIMLVWGGMLYLYGATGLAVSDAKKKMTDAIIGLIILLGSYVILSNLNPNTAYLANLKVPVVLTQQDEINLLNGSTNNTVNPGIPPDPESEALNPIPAGECTSLMAVDKTKLNAFIISKAGGGDYAARIKRVTQLLSDCNINLGSCNLVAARAVTLAGMGDEDVKRCLTNPKKVPKSPSGYVTEDCFSNIPLKYTKDNVEALRGTSYYGYTCEQTADCGKYPSLSKHANGMTCHKNDRGLAVDFVKSLIKVPGYPKSVTDKLQVGDYIWTYNANPDCTGRHSEIFLGWIEGRPGMAKVFSGSIRHKPKIKEDCFLPGCDKPMAWGYNPVISIFHPDPAKMWSN